MAHTWVTILGSILVTICMSRWSRIHYLYEVDGWILGRRWVFSGYRIQIFLPVSPDTANAEVLSAMQSEPGERHPAVHTFSSKNTPDVKSVLGKGHTLSIFFLAS